MTNEQISQLEKELWDAADQLRANSKLTAAEYKDPVLGLILLRFAQNRYEEAKIQLEAAIPEGPRGKRAPTKRDFTAAGAIMLPEVSKYEYLASLPESKDIAEAINNAMQQIEAEYRDLQGILPKNYQDFETYLLRELLRVFNKDAVKNATGDVFGRIYEYFLMKFSMQGAGAQEGGEFFTPPSLVQLIVNFIEPNHGIIHDPACGSGGMFVQTGHFVQKYVNQSVNETITCKGTELKTNNTRLAKMNLAIHGIEGSIIEANSFYSDPHDLVGKCDFVMANPPFNVNKIDKNKEFVKSDPRLFDGIGVPKADNGNYMWMQYFYHYLNQNGRAGFVMASSATDAGHSEKLIRQKLIETGHVDCIVAISNNFFYTRSLPCHLWFFDKGKQTENQDKILMIDARNVFRIVNTTINDFSPGQDVILTAVMKAYRGEKDAFINAENKIKALINNAFKLIKNEHLNFAQDIKEAFASLKVEFICEPPSVEISSPEDCLSWIDELRVPEKHVEQKVSELQNEIKKLGQQKEKEEFSEKEWKKAVTALQSNIRVLSKPVEKFNNSIESYLTDAQQAKSDWDRMLGWFSEHEYKDIEGLCKIVDLEEVEEQDYSLTPGRYVGVTPMIHEDFNFNERMEVINSHLNRLNAEADKLMSRINSNSFKYRLNEME
jgi:type I restriction enzyme M protein